MDDNWTFLELNIKPCAYLHEVIEGSGKKLKEGTEESGGKLFYSFKVSGESRIVAVINGDPEAATQLQSKAYGELTIVKCIPLRIFESYPEGKAGEKTRLDVRNKILEDRAGVMFWIVVSWDGQGITSQKATEILKEQISFNLKLRSKDETSIDCFKAIGSNQIHFFAKGPNCVTIDDVLSSFPICKLLPGRVDVEIKQIQLIRIKAQPP